MDHLDPLLGHLERQLLGRVPEGELVIKSISQYPDVLAGEGNVRRQADWNLMALGLGPHTGVSREEMVSSNLDRIMAAPWLSASCANSGRPLRLLPGIGWHAISKAQLVQRLRMTFGMSTVLPIGVGGASD